MQFLFRTLTFIFTLLFFQVVLASTPVKNVNATLHPVVADFSSIDVNGNFVVNVKVGADKAITLIGDATTLAQLKVSVVDNTLLVTGKTASPPTINISTPELNALSLDGANVVNVANLKDDFSLTAKGNNQINLSGHVKRFVSVLNGNNNLHAENLIAETSASVGRGDNHAEIHSTATVQAQTTTGNGSLQVINQSASVTQTSKP